MRADNSHHLAAAARRRREQTLTRARTVIQQLSETGQPVTITALAAQAGVSRAWLYAETELRDDIQRLRSQNRRAQPAPTEHHRASDASLRQRLTLAHERIRELEDDNRQQRDQIARLHGQLRANRLGASRVADTVHDTNNLVTLHKNQTDPR